MALKLLAPGREKDVTFTERFLREARALARLNHPNIITVHDFGEADGLHYLLMEFVDGVNLRQLLAERKITPETALAIVPPVCEALQYAHEQGIVHRDIKPENLLLDKQGRVKIADFGIARLLGSATPESSVTGQQVVGTPHYMAPEQRERPQTVDHRADIYSLGVVFYEMLTGELPTGRFPLPSRKVQVDVRLDEIVLRALEREPERRYQTAGEFRTEVETVASEAVHSGATFSAESAAPRDDWRTWAPFQSPEVKEICRHLTPEERRADLRLQASTLGLSLLLVLGLAVTLDALPAGWRGTRLVLLFAFLIAQLVLLAVAIDRAKEFLCSTQWARARGIQPQQLRTFVWPQRPSSQKLPGLNQRRWARLGFALLLAGTLGTLALMTLSSRHELALVFGGTALVFALILGLKSWRDRLGKTVTVTTLTLFVAAGVTALILAEVIPINRSRREAESQKVVARARQEIARLEALQEARGNPVLTSANTAVQIRVAADGTGDYPTIQAAIEAAPENATLQIGPGRYRERLDIRKSLRLVRTGDSMPVIGMESPQDRPVLAGERTTAPPLPTVRIRGATNVSFHHLRFTEPGLPEAGRLSSQAVIEVAEARVSLQHCAIVGGPGNGVVFSEGATGDVVATLVAAVWNTGIVFDTGSRGTVLNSDIRNCHYAGIRIRPGADGPQIRRCRISGSAWHGIRYDDVSPTVADNLIFGNARSGIYASGGTRAMVLGNVFFENEMNGLSCWYDNRDTIRGNTFAHNRREALSVLGASAPTVTRNIFSGHPVAIHQGLIGDSRSSATLLGDPTVRGNLFWQNGTNWIPGLAPGTRREPPVEIASLDETALLIEPGFANVAAYDFSLTPDSAAAKASVGVAIPLSRASPWPLQPEELAIIPDAPTRDSRQWKRPATP